MEDIFSPYFDFSEFASAQIKLKIFAKMISAIVRLDDFNVRRKLSRLVRWQSIEWRPCLPYGFNDRSCAIVCAPC